MRREIDAPPIVRLDPTNLSDLIYLNNGVICVSFTPSSDFWAFDSERHYEEFQTCLNNWLAQPFTRESFEACRADLQAVLNRAHRAGVLVWL